MIEFQGRGFTPFLAAVMLLRRNGVQVSARGGNRGVVPDDTDWALVQQVAGLDGVTVWATQPPPAPVSTTDTTTVTEPEPAPKKRAPRRRTKES